MKIVIWFIGVCVILVMLLWNAYNAGVRDTKANMSKQPVPHNIYVDTLHAKSITIENNHIIFVK